MRKDRFLIGILIGIGGVVLLALILFFLRRVNITYQPEDIPAGVLNNYALALHEKDYPRAYTYIAEGGNKPSYAEFRQVFLNDSSISGASLVIGEATLLPDEAVVSVTVLTSSGGFGSTNRSKENATLWMQDGQWKIRSAPYPYWQWAWLEVTPKN